MVVRKATIPGELKGEKHPFPIGARRDGQKALPICIDLFLADGALHLAHHAQAVMPLAIIMSQMSLIREAKFVIKVYGFLVLRMDFQKNPLGATHGERMKNMTD